jgi:hypothetical protein
MGEEAMLIACYEMYELLQAQERACAKSCLGASWKGPSVLMSLRSGWNFEQPGLPLVAGGQTGTEVVSSQKCLSFHITERQFRCFWPALRYEHSSWNSCSK